MQVVLTIYIHSYEFSSLDFLVLPDHSLSNLSIKIYILDN